jgi:hypothetical protein
MKQNDIQSWLEYWQNAKMVDTDEIAAFDQVYEARKYCSCMRVGVFSEHLVSDLQIWKALCAMRAASEKGSMKCQPAQNAETRAGSDGLV